jgi:thioredoxin reductase
MDGVGPTIVARRSTPGADAAQDLLTRNEVPHRRQARRLGAEFLIGVEIESAHPESDQIIDITLTSGSKLRGRSGVIATGVAYRQLNAPGVARFVGQGVHRMSIVTCSACVARWRAAWPAEFAPPTTIA